MYLLDISLQTRVIVGISAMVILFTSFLIAFISNQRKKMQYQKNLQAIHAEQQKALMEQNAQLEDRVKRRTLELSEQKESLQVALTDLKSSQLQLIQKEKMASLGELASGIAHEIQNPLNFVNNFAEVNNELLEEIKNIFSSENYAGSANNEINQLIEDAIVNIKKINHHGKKADNIVKNLLLHARGNSNQATLTNLNLITDEYLKVSYHGFKAKDNDFQVNIITSFDPAITQINIVPQDIGRVLMNIYNNAFYSVNSKANLIKTTFTPTIHVRTLKADGKVKIMIRDNGMGISTKSLDKIFQPFFTTKPTGEGTGLGLSLSYEIIKSHGGDIKVDTMEGEFAEFTIELNDA
jgi:C4-dicarboxylate-specific signal transduction histidine kinase